MFPLRRKVGWHIPVFLCVFLVHAGYAYELDLKPLASSEYEMSVATKLTEGFTNAGYGWTELLRTPTRWAASPERSVLSAIFLGIPYGIVRAFGRTFKGVYEVATAYSP